MLRKCFEIFLRIHYDESSESTSKLIRQILESKPFDISISIGLIKKPFSNSKARFSDYQVAVVPEMSHG